MYEHSDAPIDHGFARMFLEPTPLGRMNRLSAYSGRAVFFSVSAVVGSPCSGVVAICEVADPVLEWEIGFVWT